MVLQLLLLLMLMLLLLLMVTNPQTWLRPTETSGLTVGPYTGGVGGNSGSNNVNTSISSGFRMY